MFERQIEVISREPAGGMSEWVLGIAHAGMAEAALAQGAPREALRHSVLALARFERHDEADERAPVLLVRATALRRLGEFEAAYAELEAYHALRARVEAEAAQQYAGRVTAKVGLQRARAETESHRRIAATLETLGRIGQEITANLDADAVVRILFRYVGTLLDARSFAVWLLDEAGRELTLAFGVEDGRPISAPAVPLDHPRSWVARAVRERRDIVAPPPQPGDVPATLIAGTRVLPFAIFAPLIVGDRALGALSLQTDRADAFGENERSILWALCTYSAIAFDNAAAYRELRRAMTELQQTQNELSLRTAEYERLSLTDALTGVPNRRHFMERAKIEVAEAQRNGGALTVAMLDIDHFKDINDRYGHVAGDFVLQEIARVAKDGLRSRDFLARIGGEEFALLLPGAGPAEALAIAERMRAAIERMPLRFEGCTLGVTASFGVANAHADDGSIDDAFGRADAALYRSKQAGRNRVTGDA
jgi:diguanylate cyclase (GGDEF)-like protein